MTEIQGQVQGVIDELVESGAERGLQVAVYRHGELAVAGVADPEGGRPVAPETLFFSYSVGKGVAFGLGGVGGSYAYADTASGTTFALTKNLLTPTFDTAGRVAGIVEGAVAGSR